MSCEVYREGAMKIITLYRYTYKKIYENNPKIHQSYWTEYYPFNDWALYFGCGEDITNYKCFKTEEKEIEINERCK